MAAIESWEAPLMRYHTATRDGLSDTQKKHVVGTTCPVEVEHHLNMNAKTLHTYDDVHAEIARYVDSMKAAQGASGINSFESEPAAPQPAETNYSNGNQMEMQIDMVKGKGKHGKDSKGGDAGKKLEC